MISVCRGLVVIGVLSLMGTCPAQAQLGNVTTVEGPRGGTTTLTAQPHALAEGVSVRAMGLSTPDTTRWAVSLIGVPPDASIAFRYGNDPLPITSLRRPADGIGPTKVFLSKQAFLTIAETASVTLTVGDRTISLPQSLRREMRRIFERVAG